MRCALMLAALAALAAAGCVETKNPPFQPEDLAFEPGLLGDWADESAAPPPAGDKPAPPTAYRVEAAKGTAYRATGDGGPKDAISFFLFKLGDRYFVAAAADGRYQVLRAVASGDTVRLWPLDPAAVLGDDPGRAGHESSVVLARRTTVLTGPTAEVRAFLARHADDPAVWAGPPMVYRRKDGLKLTTAGLTGRKQRTLDYWAELRSTLQGGKFPVGGPGADAAAEWKRVAASLAALSAEGVDPDAAACGLVAAELGDAAAAYARLRRRPVDPLAALVRDATGGAADPATLPPGREAVQARAREALATLEAARAKLAGRYGGEFLPVR